MPIACTIAEYVARRNEARKVRRSSRPKGQQLIAECRRRFHYNPETGEFTFLRGWRRGEVAISRDAYGHISLCVGRHRFGAHRIAWIMTYGVEPVGNVDHINRIPDDNRIANLRDVGQSENIQNCGVRRNNKSGFKGVYLWRGKWWAAATVRGVVTRVGGFESAEIAADAYDAIVVRLRGQGATTNKKLGLI